MVKVKICGLTRREDIETVNSYMPDYVGFVFAKSQRQVNAEQAKNLKLGLDKHIKTVGVFVDAPLTQVVGLVQERIIDMIQLHGNETEEYISELKSQVSCPVIKAVRVQNARQAEKAQTLPVDYLLLDTYVKGEAGGSGKVFDWGLIPPLEKPFFLAGGLTPHNICEAVTRCRPYAVDISSGAETDGLKDPDKIKSLIETVRQQD